jgi:hypothetical protein
LLASFTNGVTSAKNGHFFTASMSIWNKHVEKHYFIPQSKKKYPNFHKNVKYNLSGKP